MRVQVVIAEAWRNVMSGAAHGIVLALAWILAVGGILMLDVLGISDVYAKQAQYLAQGGDIVILDAPGAVSATRCANLADLAGVQGAVALRDLRQPLPVAALPGSVLPTYAYRGDLAAVFDGAAGTGVGVDLSQPAAGILGTQLHARVTLTDSSQATVRSIFPWPSDGRDQALSGAVLSEIPDDDGTFDQCWVRSWPRSPQMESLMLSAADSVDGAKQPKVRPANPQLGKPHSTQELLDSRATRSALYVAPAVAVVVGFAATRSRRVEHASNLMAGARRADLAATSFTEGLIWTAAAAAFTTATLIVTTRALLPAEAATHMWATMSIMTLGALAATLVGIAGTTLLTRPASFARYVADR